MERRGNRTGNDRYEGFIPDLLREIADITREEYEIYLSPDKKYGGQNKDGSWDGMVGELMNRVTYLSMLSNTGSGWPSWYNGIIAVINRSGVRSRQWSFSSHKSLSVSWPKLTTSGYDIKKYI
jgi:hypothetical protein